jgi:hypothetical protein
VYSVEYTFPTVILFNFVGTVLGTGLCGLTWQGHMRLKNDGADRAETYSPVCSDNPCIELLVLRAVSLCLALVNIISIFLAGILVLKVSLHNYLHHCLLTEKKFKLVGIYVTYLEH